MLQNVVNALVLGSSYLMIAVGLTLIYGILKILHIAHAGVYAFGALFTVYLYELGLSMVFAISFSLIASSLLGAFIYRGFYKHVLERGRIVPLVMSVGLFAAMEDLYRLLWGPYKRPFDVHLILPDLITPNLYLGSKGILMLICTAIVIFLLYLLMIKTKLGKSLRACANDLNLAGAFGIDTDRTITYGFLIGSALAALGGILVGLYDNTVYPTMGSVPSYKAFVVVVLGGFGSIRGAVMASYILALVETLIVYKFGFLLPRDAIAFLAMIALLMFKPEGLFGKVQR
ncbi:branched-chain amino acid ABC transporter permease [Pseudothermotoga sp.]|nr:branched-chain amino acid ABC transporter permease [Pseudothermotoga sp.]MCX7812852.1 branched-chain amino acid ABC transporter permease [Pseudothermotoga sp.]MDW8140265.1 branched-chain amino acid ABC transporter permease [Pseudothermotoga sp.]